MAIDVLVVDDDRLNRRLLQKYLQAEGYSVRVAGSGEEALALYAEAHPDVVLLDVLMPGIDGYETARRMKSQLQDEYVPILMLSALTDSSSVTEGLVAGADDFLGKPYSRQILRSRLEAALRTKRLFESLAEKKQQLQELNERAERDRRVAERVMAAIIHSGWLDAPFIKYQTTPADTFNGDLLMAESTPTGAVRLMLGDFSGHGLAAAIGSQPIASMFRAMTRKGLAVESFLEDANEKLKSYLPPELFLAAVVVEVGPLEPKMSIWNAGMPPVYVVGPEGVRETLGSRQIPLGIMRGTKFRSQSVAVQEDDRIYIYSDGFTEAQNDEDEEFGDRLNDVLGRGNRDGSLFDDLRRRHETFVGGRAMADDVTIVELTYSKDMFGTDVPLADREVEFHASIEIGASLLTRHEPTDLLEALVRNMKPLEAQPHARTVLLELFNNAVDHGLLGLDSMLKDGPGGFDRYYDTRQLALRNLRQGRVRIEVQLRRRDRPELVVCVEDSGPGFDVESRLRRVDPDLSRTHGRGIPLAQQLCRALTYSDNGTRVEAVFDAVPVTLAPEQAA